MFVLVYGIVGSDEYMRMTKMFCLYCNSLRLMRLTLILRRKLSPLQTLLALFARTLVSTDVVGFMKLKYYFCSG